MTFHRPLLFGDSRVFLEMSSNPNRLSNAGRPVRRVTRVLVLALGCGCGASIPAHNVDSRCSSRSHSTSNDYVREQTICSCPAVFNNQPCHQSSVASTTAVSVFNHVISDIGQVSNSACRCIHTSRTRARRVHVQFRVAVSCDPATVRCAYVIFSEIGIHKA